MNIFIDISSFENSSYKLSTQASSLNSIWNDKQYDFFMEHYIHPIMVDVRLFTHRLNDEVEMLTSAVNELEDISSKY